MIFHLKTKTKMNNNFFFVAASTEKITEIDIVNFSDASLGTVKTLGRYIDKIVAAKDENEAKNKLLLDETLMYLLGRNNINSYTSSID
jgi:hypothetical protein